MSLILQLETSTEVCSVALSDSGSTISVVESHEPNSHTEKLTILISECIKNAKLSLKDLKAICISNGPGSYTSLRVGASVAKGICYSLNIPLLVIDSLMVLAHGTDISKISPMDHIIPMIDARRMEVYTAFFTGELKRLTSTESLILEQDLLDEYKKGNGNILLCGNGAHKYYEKYFADNVILLHTATSAGYMSKIAYNYYNAQHFQNLAYYSPNYLKSPNITKSSKNILG
jgi:tRNA threonylcarbamoyladenosine biosynthesis protein TsaB